MRPSILTDAEFAEVKKHPVIGERMLTNIESLKQICPVVRHHHERYDGLGYPDQLKGKQIPLLARIVAVADSFDAMNSDRPYHKAFARKHIDQCLLSGSGNAWDPETIWVFLGCREEIYAISHRGLGDSVHLAVKAMLKKESPDSDAAISRYALQPAV